MHGAQRLEIPTVIEGGQWLSYGDRGTEATVVEIKGTKLKRLERYERMAWDMKKARFYLRERVLMIFSPAGGAPDLN